MVAAVAVMDIEVRRLRIVLVPQGCVRAVPRVAFGELDANTLGGRPVSRSDRRSGSALSDGYLKNAA